jgi:hypothetical protein
MEAFSKPGYSPTSKIPHSNEADAVFSAFVDSITYLRAASTGTCNLNFQQCSLLIKNIIDDDVIKAWPAFDAKIGGHINVLEGVVKHMRDLSEMSFAYRERIQENLIARQAAVPESEDTAVFPVRMLPSRKDNSKFYGRKAELEKINQALDWRESKNSPLRTYTIYGRRGVGKTELALEYAYSNPAGFDAIFWIGCHTNLILRQTFTDMAKAVNLPGADRHGNFTAI